jgi:proline iminopeptidase
MKKLFLGVIFLLLNIFNLSTSAEEINELYSSAYGDSKNPAIIFLHGGPGYNSYSFEISTAQELADKGFYVIVFDQRGSGRSASTKDNQYTFQEENVDIDNLFKKYNIQKASLMGHSWGGTVAIKYAEANPDKVNSVLLVSSPLSYQSTFKAIINHCRENYKKTKSPQLQYLDMLEKMDTNSLEYSSYSFIHAMGCGLYFPPKQTQESKAISKKLAESPNAKYLSSLTQEPVYGFYTNEHYTTLDLTESLKKISSKINAFGIYGKYDGLFDDEQLNNIKVLTGNEHFKLIDNASHNVFTDQQDEFITTVAADLKIK